MDPVDRSHRYYRQREQQEREMAFDAKNEAARQVHLALAKKYQLLANGSDELS